MDRPLLAACLFFVVASAHAATFTVTNLDDSGPGSLRDAVEQANAAAGADRIDFAVTGTIVLKSGRIQISGPLAIVGPGAGSITIDGNANGRIFSVYVTSPDCPAVDGPNDYSVSISGLRLTNARGDSSAAAGAIWSEHSLALDGVIVDNNVAAVGAGLSFSVQYPGQTLTIANSQFRNNTAKPVSPLSGYGHWGGAIYVNDRCAFGANEGSVSIANSSFIGNRVEPVRLSGFAGAICTYGRHVITIADSRIVDNHVVVPNPPVFGKAYRGGAIYGLAKSLTILRSEVSENSTIDVTASSVTRGGAIGVYNDEVSLQDPASAMALNLVNSTISGNSDEGYGGALWVMGNVAVNVSNSTISGNSAPATQAGGIWITTAETNPASGSYTNAPTLTLASSIIAMNTSDDIATSYPSIPAFNINSSNSLGGTVCSTCNIRVTGSGNVGPVDPFLAPLAFSGGATRTHALLAGSPAIGAGSNPLGLVSDQRGVPYVRVFNGTTDIGAFETQATVAATTSVPTLSETALALLAAALATAGMAVQRRQN